MTNRSELGEYITHFHPFLPQKRLFKAYDIRGELRWFTDDFLLSLSFAFANLFKKNNNCVVVGYDVRQYSEHIAKFLAYACHKIGLQVYWLGQITTPMMAFMASRYSGNGLMVTASHSEKHIHGIKWLVNHQSPSGEDILALFDTLTEVVDLDISLHQKILQLVDNIDKIDNAFWQYQQATTHVIANIRQRIYPSKSISTAVKKIVIDCMNGATSRYAFDFFSNFGFDCIVLNDTPDPNFPKGNPDPCEQGRLNELCQAVITHTADIGLAFDGDGDRLMVVDSSGTILKPDDLLYILAGIAIDEYQKPHAYQSEVIFDVKCSHHLPLLIAQHGALPIMEKTGSSLMRQSLQNKSRFSIFAGELSGHFLFNDGYFILHDDAMYAGLRLLNWLSFQEKSLTDILKNLPTSISTPDMYIPIDSNESGILFIKKLLNLTKKPFWAIKQRFMIKNVQTIDGLRLDFQYGFGILRKSNTGNFLTVRFSADNLENLQKVQNVFVDLCHFIDENPDKNIAKQVASIRPL